NRLQSRFYMQRMGEASALEAVTKPAALAGRPFAPGVAEALVGNLRQAQAPSGSFEDNEPVRGQCVDAVQRQGGCYESWQRLQAADINAAPSTSITESTLASVVGERGLADFVNDALGDYYERAVQRVVRTPEIDVTEREVRDWFSSKLLTSAGTRGLVFQGREDTGGLPNAAVRMLADQFLLRAELRAGGGMWWELVHDRFVQPILESNRIWLAERSEPLISATRIWLENNRGPERL